MKKPQQYEVGERIEISLGNRIMDATVKAVIESAEGVRLQVDFGNEHTALIHEWQVVKPQGQC